MGTVYFLQRGSTAPTLTVVAAPDAVITVNDSKFTSGAAQPIPAGDTVKVRIERKGFEVWTKELTGDDLKASVQLHVELKPAK